MSYYIEMSVIPEIVEEKDVLTRGLSFISEMLKEDNARKIIKDSVGWIPNFEKLVDREEDITAFSFNQSDCQFLSDLFNFTFVYYRKYKLLCTVGIFNGYDGIVFQNSTDQCEAFEAWNCLKSDDESRKPFTNVIESVLSGECNKSIEARFSDWDTFDINDDYFTKTYLYKLIESMFEIDDVLWDRDSENFIKFELGKRLSGVQDITIRKIAAEAFNEFRNRYTK